jgi:hypothetical protein
VPRAQKPKRQHHHVWQRYLKPWATSDGAIWCRHNGRVIRTGTAVLGVEKDFYKIERLTPTDLAVVKVLFAKSRPAAQQLNEHLVNDLMRPFGLLDRDDLPVPRPAIERLVDVHASQVLEDYHATIEAELMPPAGSSPPGRP